MPKYRFVDDEPEEKKVAKFKYVGSQEFGTENNVTFYGTSFRLGEVSEVADEYAANKIRTHFDEAFEEVEGSENGDEGAPKKRGRPRKTDEEREADKAEREAEKAKREAEKEGAQPKGSELPADDTTFEEGEPF